MTGIRKICVVSGALLDIFWIKRLRLIGLLFFCKSAVGSLHGPVVPALWAISAAICFAADALVEAKRK